MPEDREFLQTAEVQNFEVRMKQPCPKKGTSASARRYRRSMHGRTIKEIKAFGSTAADIIWNYEHGWMSFQVAKAKDQDTYPMLKCWNQVKVS
jgi:hypothetical protein